MEAKIKEIVSTPLETLLSADTNTRMRTLITLGSWFPFPSVHGEDLVVSMEKDRAHPSYLLFSKAAILRHQLKRCFACGSENINEYTSGVRYGTGWRDLEMYACRKCKKMSWLIVDPTIDPPKFGVMDITDVPHSTHLSRYDRANAMLNAIYGTH
jgi:hypothetical protein